MNTPKWLRNLDGPAEKDDGPYLNAFSRGNLRAAVREESRCCGHPGYVVDLFATVADPDEWVHIGAITDVTLQDSVIVLQEAGEFIARLTGVRPLPTVHVRGRTYFVDDRLGQLRSVDEPDEGVEVCIQDF